MRYKDCTKTKLRSMSAYVYEYELEDGRTQLEMWSYHTPMVICVDGRTFVNENTYSSTTRKHLSAFDADYGINRFSSSVEFMTEKEMYSLAF